LWLPIVPETIGQVMVDKSHPLEIFWCLWRRGGQLLIGGKDDIQDLLFLLRLAFQQLAQLFGSLEELGSVLSNPWESDNELPEAAERLAVGRLGILRSAQLLEHGCQSKLSSCQVISVGVNGREVSDEFLLKVQGLA